MYNSTLYIVRSYRSNAGQSLIAKRLAPIHNISLDEDNFESWDMVKSQVKKWMEIGVVSDIAVSGCLVKINQVNVLVSLAKRYGYHVQVINVELGRDGFGIPYDHDTQKYHDLLRCKRFEFYPPTKGGDLTPVVFVDIGDGVPLWYIISSVYGLEETQAKVVIMSGEVYLDTHKITDPDFFVDHITWSYVSYKNDVYLVVEE